MSRLLRVEEAAALLGVKASCIRRWLLQRRIGSVKVGSKLVRIPEAEVQRIVEEGYRPAKGAK